MTRVKICGIRRRRGRAAGRASSAPTALGFVFWPRSPRFVDPDAGAGDRRGAAAVRDAGRRVRRISRRPTSFDVAARARLDARAAARRRARREPTPTPACRVIKAVPVGDGFDACGASQRRARRRDRAARRARSRPARRHRPDDRLDRRRRGRAAAAGHPLGRPERRQRRATPSTRCGRTRSTCRRASKSAPGIKDAGKLRAFFAALATIEARREPNLNLEP